MFIYVDTIEIPRRLFVNSELRKMWCHYLMPLLFWTLLYYSVIIQLTSLVFYWTVLICLQPLIARMGYDPITDHKTAVFSKVLALFFGGVCIGLAFVAENLGGVLQASLTIFGVVGGPLFAVFTLGMFFWIANETVNTHYIKIILLLHLLWYFFVPERKKKMYKISY